MIIRYSILIALALFYLFYTIRYTITFKKNILFTGYLKAFHFLMIWMIPFVWIFILKSLTKPTPGSYKFDNKKNPDSFTERGLGIWADSPPSN
jgi:hypothetical protein